MSTADLMPNGGLVPNGDLIPNAGPLTADGVDDYLRAQEQKDLLRFITCGSVDDGKSTLIGRILHDSHQLLEDQLATLRNDSARSGTRGGELDLALLVDGLAAEREQGITIDVAYRFFTTERRKFIVIDAPGHEQYTRNMVTGASNADVAVILVDARKGVLSQTRRHSHLVALLGITTVALAVNKIDLIGHSRTEFERIAAEYTEWARGLGITDVTCVPVSALNGDNIAERAAATDWYRGPTLLEFLERVPAREERAAAEGPFRMPVQWVNRPDAEFRGYAGPVVGGTVRPGDPVRVLPSGRESTVARIVTADGDLPEAVAGQSVTLTLTDEIDLSRGDLVCAPHAPARTAHALEADLVWMAEQPLRPGLRCLLKLGTATAGATVSRIAHTVDVHTQQREPADRLELNGIGRVVVQLDRPLPFDPYRENRETGGFVLLDRISGDTLAAGLAGEAAAGGRDVHFQRLEVGRADRARLTGHRSFAVWFTGLSGAGKSTVADLVERRLHGLGRHTYLLDGDNIRHGLSRDLGFSAADRREQVRRTAEVARLMVDGGLITLVSLISPTAAERDQAKEIIGAPDYCEVYVSTPLAVAEQRDPKGLYRRARTGELPGFTGIDSPYEPPVAPDIALDTSGRTPEESAELVLAALRNRGLLES